MVAYIPYDAVENGGRVAVFDIKGNAFLFD